MEDLGTKLQSERLKRNIELQEIANATHISISVLKDIENNNFSKYTGDEQYIKMYLRKYAQYLGIDSREYVSDYMTLTEGFKQEELEKAVSKAEEKKPKKQVTISNPKFTKSKKVYEDQNTSNYIRYVIIVALIIAIIGVAYYGVSMLNKNNTDFENKENFSATGEVIDDSEDSSSKENSDTSKESTKDDTDEEEDDSDDSKTSKDTSSTRIEHTAAYTYTVYVPSDSETFDVEFDFVCNTWCSLYVNEQPYSGFEARTYNDANAANDLNADPEVVKLTFNTNDTYQIMLINGYNTGHKYYFNGVEVETPKSEEKEDRCDITFNIVKEG